MSKEEIVHLLSGEGRKPCLQIYRRADGTILTDDCPVGLRRIRDGARRLSKLAASLWALVIATGSATAENRTEVESKGPDGRQLADRLMGVPVCEPPTRGVDPFAPGLVQTAKENGRDSRRWVLFASAKAAASNGDMVKAKHLFAESLRISDSTAHDPKFRDEVLSAYRFAQLAELLNSNEFSQANNNRITEKAEALPPGFLGPWQATVESSTGSLSELPLERDRVFPSMADSQLRITEYEPGSLTLTIDGATVPLQVDKLVNDIALCSFQITHDKTQFLGQIALSLSEGAEKLYCIEKLSIMNDKTAEITFHVLARRRK